MRRPQLQSTLARAVAPVAAGIVFFGLVFAALWGVAALTSRNSEDTTDNLAPSFQEMGRVEPLAKAVEQGGPIILPDLVGDDRHIVLDHTGDDPTQHWAIYLAHPADRDATCQITQVRNSRQFVDCDGRTIEIADLASPPQGVGPIYNKDRTLTLSLRAAPTATSSSVPTVTS